MMWKIIVKKLQNEKKMGLEIRTAFQFLKAQKFYNRSLLTEHFDSNSSLLNEVFRLKL